MSRRAGVGRAKAVETLRSLLARLSDALRTEADGPGQACWEGTRSVYLEMDLPALGVGEVDISVVGDKVFVRVAVDPTS